MALLLVFLRLGCNAWLNVLQKRVLQKHLSAALLLSTTFALLAFWIAPLLFFYSFENLPAAFWCNMMLVAVLDVPGNYFLVKSLGLAELSLIGPLNSYKPVVALLLGVLVLGEVPSLTGLAGVVIILLGSLLLSPKPDLHHPHKRTVLWRDRGAWHRLLALLFTASASIFLKAAINVSSALHTFLAWALLCAAGAFLLQLFAREPRDQIGAQLLRKNFTALLLMAALFLGMQLVTLQAFALMNVAYVLALFQLSGLLNVLLGWKIFNEGNILRRAIASVIMIAGAVLLIIK